MADLLVTEQLRAYLIAQGVVDDPNTPSGDLPVCWLDPRAGAPDPTKPVGSSKMLVATHVTLRRRGIAPPGDVRLEGFLEDALVDVIGKSTHAPLLELAQRAIRAELADRNGWTMAALRVESSRLYMGDTPAPSPAPAYYVSVQTFRIMARTLSLAGLPYA